jgi:TRAP-type transport system small permease protein
MCIRVLRGLNRSEEFLCVTLLALTVVVSGIGVFWRFVLGNPFIWTEEISRLCMVWLTFIGMSLGVKESAHMRLEFLSNTLPDRGKHVLQIILMLVVVLFSAVMAYVGWRMVLITWNFQLSASQWSMGMFYLPIVLSGIFMFVRGFRVILINIRALLKGV